MLSGLHLRLPNRLETDFYVIWITERGLTPPNLLCEITTIGGWLSVFRNDIYSITISMNHWNTFGNIIVPLKKRYTVVLLGQQHLSCASTFRERAFLLCCLYLHFAVEWLKSYSKSAMLSNDFVQNTCLGGYLKHWKNVLWHSSEKLILARLHYRL